MFLHFISHYKYVVLFLGVFLGGDTALLAGLYLTVIGVMTLWYVIPITLVASLLADACGYGIGMLLSYDRLRRLPYFRTHLHQVAALEHFLNDHSLKTLFYSKFVYGTRTIVQILCGIHSLDLVEYFTVSFIGISAWVVAMIVIVKLVHVNAHSFTYLSHSVEWGFALLVVFVVLVHVLVRKFVLDKIDKEEI